MYKKVLLILAGVIIIGLIAATGIMIYDKIQEKYRESDIKAELSEYYRVPDGEAMIIFDEKIYEKNAVFRNGEPYLDMSTIKERYSKLFTWCPEEKRMYYTTASSNYILTPDSVEMLINEKPVTTTVPSLVMKGEEPYIAMSFLLNCSNITYKVCENPSRVLVTYSTDDYLCAVVKEESSIRVSQDIKSDYLEKLPEGSVVRVIEGGGIQQNGFIKVMSEDGVRGYFLQEKLDWENRYEVTPSFTTFKEEEYMHVLEPHKVYLSWQLVYSTGHIDEMLESLDKNPEVNVVAPTWFFMKGSNGDIISYGDSEYVKAAHDRKVKVWAVLKNDSEEGVFDLPEDSHKVFSSYEARKNLIKNLIDAVKKCGADGINIDIEGIKVETGIYFIQFLRELYLKSSEYGMTISVDNYIPEDYNAFYNIPEQRKIADYVVIMGYDEHYAGSDAGSVASLPWFKYAADLSLTKCGKEQLIMGVPFYTRLWKEVQNGDQIKTTVARNLSIREQNEFVKERNLQGEWSEEAGQYYYEYEKDGAKYRLWAEEEKSLTLKAMVIREKEYAGVAAWMMGGEIEGLWSSIKTALEGDVSSLVEIHNGDADENVSDNDESDQNKQTVTQ